MRKPETGSAWLMRAGTLVFWTLAASIVVARAVWFDPGLAARFDHVVAFARSLAAPFGV